MKVLLLALLFVLAACAPDVVQVQGNGLCHPSQDLPAHKAVAQLPRQDTGLADFFALFAGERKQHAADDRDYNSLYTQCVSGD